MLDWLKPDRPNWRHYFGSFAFLVLILQLISGIFLTLFYEPTLKDAYKSVQMISYQIPAGSLFRNLHRWIALGLFGAILVHTIRSTLRKDFMNPNKRIDWMTGVFLVWPLFLLLYTGLILPWEWKGYWFMEMIASYAATVPIMGPDFKAFFLMEFTLPRYLVVHILLLPIISLVLVDYHMLTKLRKRGIFRHMARHFWITLPFFAFLVYLSVYATIPSNDPMEFGMPLEGAFIPEPESLALLFLLPLKRFSGTLVPLLSIYIPSILLLAIAFMPFYLKSRKFLKPTGEEEEYEEEEAEEKEVKYEVEAKADDELSFLSVATEGGEGATDTELLSSDTELPPSGSELSSSDFEFGSNDDEQEPAPVKKPRSGLVAGVLWGLLVFVIFSAVSGLMYYGTYESPTLGCNSCHNLSRGFRMGVPPPTFKDRRTLPNLDDDKWMMGHWFYPTEIY